MGNTKKIAMAFIVFSAMTTEGSAQTTNTLPTYNLTPALPASPTNPASGQVYTPSATSGPVIPPHAPNYVEAGMNYYGVSNHYGNWFGQFINLQYQYNEWNRWSFGVQNQEAFHDQGVSGYIANRHVFNEDWFSNVGVSLGSNATFLPRYRVDADINRQLLEGRNLVATVGMTVDKANDIYDDQAVLFGMTYYLPAPWIIQGNVRFNNSTPGNVVSPSFSAAVTTGYNQDYFLTARYTIGREAYQLLGSNNIVNSFTGNTVGVNWRQWVDSDWGFNVGTEYYTNRYYNRTGGTISVFKQF